MDLIVTTPEKLEELIGRCLTRYLTNMPAAQQPEAEDKPLTTDEAVAFLGKTRTTLYKWRRKGIIKAHVLGGRVYFFKSELMAAIKK